MFFARNSFQRTFAAVAVLTFFVIGCGSDDPMSHQEEHFEPEGLVIIDSGNRFFRYFQGQIDASGGRKDHLDAPLNEETSHWSIRFLDDHGDEIDPPDDPDFKFTWAIADPTVLEVVQDADDVGKFDFHLRGLKVGETTIELQVTHDDHVDFRTIPIPVHVGE